MTGLGHLQTPCRSTHSPSFLPRTTARPRHFLPHTPLCHCHQLPVSQLFLLCPSLSSLLSTTIGVCFSLPSHSLIFRTPPDPSRLAHFSSFQLCPEPSPHCAELKKARLSCNPARDGLELFISRAIFHSAGSRTIRPRPFGPEHLSASFPFLFCNLCPQPAIVFFFSSAYLWSNSISSRTGTVPFPTPFSSFN